jgi:hypothetical protein
MPDPDRAQMVPAHDRDRQANLISPPWSLSLTGASTAGPPEFVLFFNLFALFRNSF